MSRGPDTTRRYAIVEAIGRGAFGSVYRARMSSEGSFHKEVAIKLLRTDLGERAEAMARRQRDEARLLGLVRHRAILHVDGLVRLNGTWAVVMEFVDGCNLRDAMRLGRFPPSVAVAVCGEVAGGLCAAWEATTPQGKSLRLIHRDVKPPNIQLSASGDVKLLDFGVARAQFEGREAETVDVLLGTLRYMAPERLDGFDGPPGDIYALGIVLVELLTRKPVPKTSGNEGRHQETLKTAIDRTAEALAKDGAKDPHVLMDLVRRMLSYDPRDRPEAREVERTLWDLRTTYDRPRPTDWCRDRVPKVQALVKPTDEDPLVGSTLIEQTRSGTVPPPKPNRARWVMGAVAAAGLATTGATAAAIAVVVGASTFDPPPPEPAVVAPVVELPRMPPPAPAPAVAPEPEPEPEAVVVRIAPKPPPPPVPAPEPESVEAPPSPVGTVVVIGDGVIVSMVGEAGTFPPGDLPPGPYEVRASFGGGVAMEVTSISVSDGGTVELTCDAMFQLCKARNR